MCGDTRSDIVFEKLHQKEEHYFEMLNQIQPVGEKQEKSKQIKPKNLQMRNRHASMHAFVKREDGQHRKTRKD